MLGREWTTITLEISAAQASILAVLAISFVDETYLTFVNVGFLELAYVENLLNLSIAGAYPICFLAMSGEMKRLVV